jgi:hypothetical protein
MSSQAVILETIFGPLELRPRRGPSDEGKVSIAMCEESVERALHKELTRGNAHALKDLAREEAVVRSGFGIDDDEIVAGLMQALRTGRLVAAAPGMTAGADDQKNEAWAAYYAFQARFGKEFNVAMRRHRIVGREQVADIRQNEDYDVVPAVEAAAVLERLAKTVGVGPWQAATVTLSKHLFDLRSPAGTSGFMLLRAPASHAERIVSPEDIITPAKLKKLKEEKEAVFEIEIEQRYHDDSPVQGAKFTLVFEGGRQVDGVLNSDGKALVKGVPNETAELRFGPDSRDFKVVDRKKNKSYRGRVPTEAELQERLEFFMQLPQD